MVLQVLALILIFTPAVGTIVYWPMGYGARGRRAFAEERNDQAWAEILAASGILVAAVAVALAIVAVTVFRSGGVATLGWCAMVGGAVLHLIGQFFAGMFSRRGGQS